MEKLPPPDPALVSTIEPVRVTIGRGEVLWRIHTTSGDHRSAWDEFRTWGPVPGMRFDPQLPPPGPSAEGVMYVAPTLATCLAEVFWETRRIVRDGKQVSGFRLARDLHLLDLRADWLVRAGGSFAINGTDDKVRTQAWARVLHGVHPDADGLLHASSVTGAPALALFDPPAATALDGALELAHALDDPVLDAHLVTVARQIGYRLL